MPAEEHPFRSRRSIGKCSDRAMIGETRANLNGRRRSRPRVGLVGVETSALRRAPAGLKTKNIEEDKPQHRESAISSRHRVVVNRE